MLVTRNAIQAVLARETAKDVNARDVSARRVSARLHAKVASVLSMNVETV